MDGSVKKGQDGKKKKKKKKIWNSDSGAKREGS